MDEKKLNESGEELNDEQMDNAAGGFFAPRPQFPPFVPPLDPTPGGPDEKPGDVFADIKLPKKPGL